jgi:DNA-directed RNA polymerase specialized sigma54-like protein
MNEIAEHFDMHDYTVSQAINMHASEMNVGLRVLHDQFSMIQLSNRNTKQKFSTPCVAELEENNPAPVSGV